MMTPFIPLSLARLCRALFVVVSAVWLAACTAPGGPGASRSSTVLFAPTEVIALAPDRRIAAAVRRAGAEAGFDLLEEVALPALDLEMLRFSFPPPFDGQSAIDTLEAAAPGVTAGVNHAYGIASLEGADRFDYADALLSWPAGGCRAQGAIGMLDTGVDRSRVTGGSITARSFVRGAQATARHGTDVATVLLDDRRVANARIYSAAVVDRTGPDEGFAGVDSLIKGIDWLSAQGVRVVNVSLAGPYNKLLDRSVQQAASDGMILVAAVGNDGASGPPRYPAAFDDVIAVTAVDANRRIYRNASRGAHIDLAAPGVDIAIADGAELRFVSGTSMAAPFVTARIATDPALYGQSAPSIRRALATTSEDLGPPGVDQTYGAGLLQAAPRCPR